jgi:predicted PurR-regulated permease PerM
MTTTNQSSRITAHEVWIVLVNVLAAAALVLATWRLAPMITWIVLGLFLALAFLPIVSWLTKRRWKRGWAVFAVFTLVFVVLGGLIALFVPMLIAQGNALVASSPEILERVRTFGPIHWAEEQFQNHRQTA